MFNKPLAFAIIFTSSPISDGFHGCVFSPLRMFVFRTISPGFFFFFFFFLKTVTRCFSPMCKYEKLTQGDFEPPLTFPSKWVDVQFLCASCSGSPTVQFQAFLIISDSPFFFFPQPGLDSISLFHRPPFFCCGSLLSLAQTAWFQIPLESVSLTRYDL